MKVLGLSYNCSTHGDAFGLEVGDSSQGFDIAAIAVDLDKMIAYVKQKNPDAEVSTTYSCVGTTVDQIGNGTDARVVAAVIEVIDQESDGTDVWNVVALIFEYETELLM